MSRVYSLLFIVALSSVFATTAAAAPNIEMVFVKGNCYQMGDSFREGNRDEIPVHEVCVDDFYIGKYEVTQAQWHAVMGNNPSNFKGDLRPVEQVSWNDVQEFINRLSRMTGKRYRLPTEAEWEFAARGGVKSRGYKYAGSNSVDEVAWYKANSGGKTVEAGRLKPNELGIYDMSGNVLEWCSDRYDPAYYKHSLGEIHLRRNPQGPSGSSAGHVQRGGSWYNSPSYARATHRAVGPNYGFSNLGFRLVLPSVR